MKDLLSGAKQYFLSDQGLSLHNLEHTLSQVMCAGVSWADLYFESVQQENWLLEEGKIKRNHFYADTGFGLRAVTGCTASLAHSNFLTQDALNKALVFVKQVSANASSVQNITLDQPLRSRKLYYGSGNPIDSLSDAEKVNILHTIDRLARQLDPRIKQVIASLSASYQIIFIVNTDGKLAADMRPLIRLSVSAAAHQGSKTQTGTAGGGCRGNYDFFDQTRLEAYVNHAVNQALLGFEMKPAPSGVMPVVLGAGWPGVLLHEAIGHGLEGDSIRKKTSAFWNRKNEKIAHECCTIVDDAVYPSARGSLNIDDEGESGQYTVLIEKGILKHFMQDKLNAALMNTASTGNGRREGYADLPIPRMTNTYLLPGKYAPSEIIASVDRGLYAVDFSGGQVDVTSGKFVFSAKEAYLIEKGKITQPVRGAALIGDGPSILHQLSMVGNDLALDSGVGVCGKDGQSVPVGVGQPTVKLDAVTVGGTQQS
jgi:TldD protein